MIRLPDVPRRIVMAIVSVLLLSPAVVGHLHNLVIFPFIVWLGSGVQAIFGRSDFYLDTAVVNLFIAVMVFGLALFYETIRSDARR